MNEFILMTLLSLFTIAFDGAEPPTPEDPVTLDAVDFDEEALEGDGFDVDRFDFSPMDEKALNTKVGEGDLSDAIAQLKHIVRQRRARMTKKVDPPRKLLLEEGTYGERVYFDVYGRANRRD